MQWLDLSAYGDIRLRIGARDPDPAVMFVMDGGDAIAEALKHSGFRRTMSGLWFRTFAPADCADILRWLTFDLPLAVIRDIDPAEILQGYRGPAIETPAAVVPVVAEAEVDISANDVVSATTIEKAVISECPPSGLFMSSTLQFEALSSDDVQTENVSSDAWQSEDLQAEELESEIVSDVLGAEGTSREVVDGGFDATADRRGAAAPFEETLTALAALAALVGAPFRRGEVTAVVAPPADPVAIEKQGIELRQAGVAPSGTDGIVSDTGVTQVFEMDFAWIVTADVSDARSLTGLERLEERSHLIAKLAFREDAPAASRRVGMLARSVAGGPAVRIVAVVRGIDGSGFGQSGDFLLVGDPGDSIGPLLDRAVTEDIAAA
jgi:hypothetical protein